MDSTAQRNGLNLEDPLENLREFFRNYWRFILKKETEKAHDVWEKTISAELESIYQFYPDISRENIQSVLFEEKRRLQDHNFLVETIVEKFATHLNQTPLSTNAPPTAKQSISHLKNGLRADDSKILKNNSKHSPNTSKESSTTGLDLTAMIDSMIEDEKFSKR